MSQENPYAPPLAAVADIGTGTSTSAGTPCPPLWNPGAAASWSLLFSPLFGAILHMKNWQAMGEPEKAAASKTWAIVTAAFLVLSILLVVALPESKGADRLGRVGGFALLIAWYYSLGKSQRAVVIARYGKHYPRKGWAKPLGLAVAAMLAFVLVATAVGLAAAVLSGTI